jgi:hypothetical protein
LGRSSQLKIECRTIGRGPGQSWAKDEVKFPEISYKFHRHLRIGWVRI